MSRTQEDAAIWTWREADLMHSGNVVVKSGHTFATSRTLGFETSMFGQNVSF